jgi:hypothetical protein
MKGVCLPIFGDLADESEHWLDKWKDGTQNNIDGVLLVTGESLTSVQDGLVKIQTIPGGAITERHQELGQDRGVAGGSAAAGKEQ